jgi:hypothetical protein
MRFRSRRKAFPLALTEFNGFKSCVPLSYSLVSSDWICTRPFMKTVAAMGKASREIYSGDYLAQEIEISCRSAWVG